MRSKTLAVIIGSALMLGLGAVLLFTLPGGLDYLDRLGAQLKDLVDSGKTDVAEMLASRLDMDQEVVYKYKLSRVSSSSGLGDLNSTDQYVEGTNPADSGLQLQPGQISNYQAYVTPNDPAVQAIAKGKSAEAIYREAISWVWVEDKVLHGVDEKWLSPNFFLTKSASLGTNPVQGSIASDCESQAYTLVSALRAAGMPAENVRVVTGKVDFGTSSGGHAWVEVFDSSANGWFQLEATSGSYYDSSSGTYQKSDGLPYTFFKTYQYPAVQIWTYFNDKYFWDNNRQQGNIADNWLTTDTVAMQAPQSQVEYELPDETRELREQREREMQEELDRQLRELRRQIQEQEELRRQQQSRPDASEEQRPSIPEQQQGAIVAVVGRVEEVNAGVITMATRLGRLFVSISSGTEIDGPLGASIDTIKPGAVIMVEGEQESEDGINARTIHIIK